MENEEHNDALDCEEGHYPYPDACVKLVMGVTEETGFRSVLDPMRSMVLVSTKDAAAEALFKHRVPGFAPQVVSSLDDVRWQVQQLRDMEATRKDGWFLRKLREPHMVTFHWTMGVLHRRFLLAGTSAQACRAVIPQPYVGVAVSLTELEALLARMERARTGEEVVDYAWSYGPGGDWQRSAERRIAQWTPEEKAWSHEQYKNYLRYFPLTVNEEKVNEENHHD
ncbi:hypothetical protein SAMN05216466_106217 [Paraburkholderia phenazinium]|uniref:Uncharacterized protein n=1 Tax=Paraburkholderia phenazinium TaxID=60549 RepID=A0A1G7YJC3_9BURK|nr:hypothetical protein [Paraburkholderia phenazinium]SDG96678.1 hypothetical protein SAMN05216466_106217 [Paraburkholderia phenazinium]